jgi:hypothetical protein
LPRVLFAESRALGKGLLCRELTFAKGLALGKEQICRWALFAESLALDKEIFAKNASFSRQRALCRVPVFLPSAKIIPLDKGSVSCSVNAAIKVQTL